MPSAASPEQPEVVVGYDGSPAPLAAARWAADEAALRRSTLRVVYAWQYPGLGFPDESPMRPADDRLPAGMETSLSEGLGPRTDCTLAYSTIEGHPTDVLVQAAMHAQLLVVGAHRQHLTRDLNLGSVSRHCASRAGCPVVIVHPES